MPRWPAGRWAPSLEKLAIEQTSGRQRINIHGAIDSEETGQTRMIEALTIDAASTIRLLQSIEALHPMLALIHVFLDNARYHHAKLVQEWLVAEANDASSCTSSQRICDSGFTDNFQEVINPKDFRVMT